jgi:hypothetical protein
MRINILRFLIIFFITFSGFGPTPAFSDNNDSFAKFLLGAATLMALSQPNVSNHHVEYSVTSHRTIKTPKRLRHYSRRIAPSPKKFQYYQEILPAECNRLMHTQIGIVRIAPNRCLDNKYSYTDHLPNRCQRAVQKLNGHILRGYKVRCLQRYGYSFHW